MCRKAHGSRIKSGMTAEVGDPLALALTKNLWFLVRIAEAILDTWLMKRLRRFFLWLFRWRIWRRLLAWTAGLAGVAVLAGPFMWALVLHGYHLAFEAISTDTQTYLETIAALDDETFFANVRNLGLIALGILGTILATWRSVLAHKQTQTANRQAEIANTQAETANKRAKIAESGLIIDRFQKGAAMLDSTELSVRLAGIYALRELAMSDPDETYIMVLDLLCDFVRERSKERQPDLTKVSKENPAPDYSPFPPDLHKAMETVFGLRKGVGDAKQLESTAGWGADLHSANLSGVLFMEVNLSGANLSYANLSGAVLDSANLSGAFVAGANLSGATLSSANLTGALIIDANLSGADLEGADLSQSVLRCANLSSAKLGLAVTDHIVGWFTIWAYDGRAPIDLPANFKDRIALRKPGEPWPNFVDRMIAERPELDWILEEDPVD